MRAASARASTSTWHGGESVFAEPQGDKHKHKRMPGPWGLAISRLGGYCEAVGVVCDISLSLSTVLSDRFKSQSTT